MRIIHILLRAIGNNMDRTVIVISPEDNSVHKYEFIGVLFARW